MKTLKSPMLFICLGLFSPLTMAIPVVEATGFVRSIQSFEQTATQKAQLLKTAHSYAKQIEQYKIQKQQMEMYQIDDKFKKKLSSKSSGNDFTTTDSDKVDAACKNGIGDGVCVIAMQQQKKSQGGVDTSEAGAEYTEGEYAAGSPHKRLPKVYHEMERRQNATDTFLRQKYFPQLTAIEKELRELNTGLTTNASNATHIALVDAKTNISLGKLKVLSAQLEAMNTQLKLLDQKHQYEAVKQNMEAAGRGKDNQSSAKK